MKPRRPSPAAPGSRPPRVFISYRREDAPAYAGRLYDALTERFGEKNVFMDIDTIDLGTDYSEVIDRALASTDAVVAVIGRGWLGAADESGRRRLDDPDDVLRLELERALAGRHVVVPACVQGTALPAEEELPATLAPLSRRQGIELRDTAWRDDVARLVRRLERIPVAEEPEDASASRQTTGRASRRRGVLAAAVLVALAAGVAAAVAIATGGGDDGGGTSGAERRLLAAVPAVLRADCQSIDWGPDSALASVGCAGSRVSAEYYLFPSAAVLAGWYVLAREEAAVAPDSGTCTGAAFRGEGVYSAGGGTAGRRFCWEDEGEPKLVWTHDERTVGASANVWEGTGPEAIESLLRQWRCCLQPKS